MVLRGAISVLVALAATTAVASDWPKVSAGIRFEYAEGRDSAERALAKLPLSSVEGLWQFPSGGATVAVVGSGDGFDVVVVQAPDRSLRPGTVIGRLDYSGERGVYRSSFFTSLVGKDRRPSAPRNFILHQSTDGAFIRFEAKNKGYRINLWRLLPVMYSRIISRGREPQQVDGCRRVFPEPDPPIEPRYL